MVDTAKLDAARQLVADLRARGDERNAQVVEQLIAAAGGAQDAAAPVRRSDLLTIRQAARALNVRAQTIKSWVATGKVRTSIKDGQTMVHRDSLLAFLDSLRASHTARASRSEEAATRRDLLVSLTFPPEMLDRLRELLDVRQERSLSPDERAELDRLEVLSARISAARLREWLHTRGFASPETDHPPEDGLRRPYHQAGPPGLPET